MISTFTQTCTSTIVTATLSTGLANDSVMVKYRFQETVGTVMAYITRRCGRNVIRALAYRNDIVMAGFAQVCCLIVSKGDYHRQPLTGIMTGFTGIAGDSVRRAFIASTVTTAGDTRTNNGLVVAKRNDGRDPSAGGVAGVAAVSGLWMCGRFAADTGA